jgi:DNA end-binding protein Ku
MQQLLYADEVRTADDLGIAPTDVRESELKLAIQLIEQISSEEFHPEAYEDAVKQRIEAAIERKVEGKEISVSDAPPEARGGAQVIDLMAALRASLGNGKGRAKDKAGSADNAGTPARKAPKRASAARGEAAPRKHARK